MEAFLLSASIAISSLHEDDPIQECGSTVLAQLHDDAAAALALADKKLRSTFPFKDVPACWRRLYTDASVALALDTTRRALGLEKQADTDSKNGMQAGSEIHATTKPSEVPVLGRLEDKDPGWLTDVVRYLDMALIMTGGCMREDLIAEFFKGLEELTANLEGGEPAPKRIKISSREPSPSLPRSFSEEANMTNDIQFPVRRCSMTLTSFQYHLDSSTVTPLVFTGLIDHWPARQGRPWTSPEYLLQRTLGGRRLVPIEIGRSYTDDEWGQKIVSFREFLEEYIIRMKSWQKSNGSPSAREDFQSDDKLQDNDIAYLAQHDLFTQVPSLRHDIAIPDLCYTDPPSLSPNTSGNPKPQAAETPKLEEPLLNAWFGPAGTISPLHTDPYHNILCQVVGKKYVRLYAPSENNKLEPRGLEDGIDMSNTSSVPVEVVEMGALASDDADELRWDNFLKASYVETVLSEGECLYIPVGWWHYVRSLTISFSVSFWWN